MPLATIAESRSQTARSGKHQSGRDDEIGSATPTARSSRSIRTTSDSPPGAGGRTVFAHVERRRAVRRPLNGPGEPSGDLPHRVERNHSCDVLRARLSQPDRLRLARLCAADCPQGTPSSQRSIELEFAVHEIDYLSLEEFGVLLVD
jgi:hypothetical protein